MTDEAAPGPTQSTPDWWRRPRCVSIVIDNPSWVLPFGERLVAQTSEAGDEAALIRSYDAVPKGDVAFYLGCLRITPPDVLARNRKNLVVHASDLPAGRGFSPLTWQILEGRNDIVVCLLEMAPEADAGPIVARETASYAGHELVDELRAEIGDATIRLCAGYLAESAPPPGEPQQGTPSVYARRRPADSRLDPHRTIAEQFDLLRTVDNERYPAFFEYRGHEYVVRIEKRSPSDS